MTLKRCRVERLVICQLRDGTQHFGTKVGRVLRLDRVARERDGLQRGQIGQLLDFRPIGDPVVLYLNQETDPR